METLNFTAQIETWAPRLRKLKIRHYAFAKEVGVYPGQFSQYICGNVKPKIEQFERIENKLREIEAR